MTTTKDEVCVGCGKGGDDLKRCNACKLVKYYGVDCQRTHRPKHKKECKKRVSELHDEALFQHPPSQEECSICFLKLPIEVNKITYKPCCGKFLCSGCMYAAVNQDDKRGYLCPFCRTPSARSLDEEIQRLERRMKLDDPEAISMMGHNYLLGEFGLQEDTDKAQELFHKAAECGGSMNANYYLGGMHCNGYGVQIDKKKAKYYLEIAAMEGHVEARRNLGVMEKREGNHDRAMKHYIISASVGDVASLNMVKTGYVEGLVTKDKFAQTLRDNKESQDELKSEWRDKAAAAPPDTWRWG